MSSTTVCGEETAVLSIKPPIDITQCKNILVVKMDLLDEFILATPFLRGLRMSAPNATIDLVTTIESMQLAEVCPLIDHVVCAEVQETADKQVTVALGGLPENIELYKTNCENKTYDVALVARYGDDFRLGSFVAASSHAKRIVGFATPPERFATTHDYANAFYTDVINRPFPCHEGEHYKALLQYVNGTPDTDAFDAWALQQDVEAADRLFESAGIETGRPLLTIFLGATRTNQALPNEKLECILRFVNREIPDLQILTVGPQGMKSQSTYIASKFNNCIDVCGNISIRELVAIVSKSTAVLSFGTMPAHIAAAVDVPSILLSQHPADGIPGSRYSPFRVGPRGRAKCIVLQPKTALSPCKGECNGNGPHCIVTLVDDEAASAIIGVIQGK